MQVKASRQYGARGRGTAAHQWPAGAGSRFWADHLPTLATHRRHQTSPHRQSHPQSPRSLLVDRRTHNNGGTEQTLTYRRRDTHSIHTYTTLPIQKHKHTSLTYTTHTHTHHTTDTETDAHTAHSTHIRYTHRVWRLLGPSCWGRQSVRGCLL